MCSLITRDAVDCDWRSNKHRVAHGQVRFCYGTTARRQWQREFTTKPPSESTFRLVFKKFTKTGSVHDAERSGRPSIEEGDVSRIQEEFEDNPRSSVRDAAGKLGIPRETLRRTLKESIGMKTFHITRVQELLPDDVEPRLQFCVEINQLCHDPYFMRRLFPTKPSSISMAKSIVTIVLFGTTKIPICMKKLHSNQED